MRTHQRWLQRIAKAGLILTMGASMSASAGWFGFGGTSWKEEVLLHDGQKIIVKRSQSYGGQHEIGQPSPIKEHTISFTPPGSKTEFTWTSEYGEDIGRTNFNLLALHVLNGTPYVIASPNLCLSYNKWGRPNPPYVFFKYDGKEWRRVEVSELPAEFKTVNIDFRMTWHIRDKKIKFDAGGLLSAETIKRHNEENEEPEYRTILREPLANVGRDCMEEIRTGDGWMSIDWFSSQKSHESCLKVCKREKVTSQNCPCAKLFKGK